jgi:hypothetical protein
VACLVRDIIFDVITMAIQLCFLTGLCALDAIGNDEKPKMESIRAGYDLGALVINEQILS